MEFSEEVRSGDRTAYLAALFAPESVRPALLTLAAYRLELRRVVERAKDPLAAEIRLQWWRDAIRDEGFGESAPVPLVRALREGAARYGWPLDTLCAISEGHIHDLYADPFADWDAFDGYAGEVFGAPIQLAAMALAVDRLGEADGLAMARQSGTAAGYAGVVLCAAEAVVAERARLLRGRTGAPVAAWEGVDLRAALEAGSAPGKADSAVAALAEHGLRADASLRAAMAAVPGEVAPAFLPALAARPQLVPARRRPHDVRPVAPWRVSIALWRAARRLSRRGGR